MPKNSTGHPGLVDDDSLVRELLLLVIDRLARLMLRASLFTSALFLHNSWVLKPLLPPKQHT